MNNCNKIPLKIYIQDIFRATSTQGNKYVYELCGIKFKNIMIHGVVTAMYNTNTKSTNFELSDPTGCVQIYYDITKNNAKLSEPAFKDLVKSFSQKSRQDNALTMSSLLDSIENNVKNPFKFEIGSHVSVIGDIFIDDFKNTRMICAYSCKTTSVERDVVWLEELRYLYDNYYL